MEIVKNPTYLRFVKYEHWLAFAGILLVISPWFSINGTMFFVPYPNQDKFLLLKPFIFNSLLSIFITGSIISTYSIHFVKLKRFWLIAPALILLVSSILFYKDSVQMITIFLGLVAQEFYWRGIFVEVLKRQGFSTILSVIIPAILSSLSYFYTFIIFSFEHFLRLDEHFLAFLIFSFVSGFVRQYSIFACVNLVAVFITFYLKGWWRW